MCFANSRVNGLRRWNWDGERIIHDSIVPSSRPVVMQQTGWYDIDVREFLVSKDNAIMRRTLEGDIRKFIEKLEGASWELFRSREPGSFDLRAYVITESVSKKVEYRLTEGLDPWQFPDETLKLRSGDCEDRALLIASMLLASGISSFNVRVALGKFRAWFGKKHEDIDYVWVMYKNEAGKWQVIEPAARVSHAKKTGKKGGKWGKMPDSAEYIPFFIFNDVHLWTMQSHALYEGKNAVRLKRDWSKLDPSFAGWVHKSILNEALTPDVCPDWVLASLPQPPDYGTDSDFDIASGKFTTNKALWKGSHAEAAALWKGKLISGRYAQKNDAKNIVEAITSIPASLMAGKSFSLRGALPHHNEIAVDEDEGSNVLYDNTKFAAQYKLRKDAAVRHIRQAFVENQVGQHKSSLSRFHRHPKDEAPVETRFCSGCQVRN